MFSGSTDFEVGSTVFERYEILGLIASGAQGRVYLALDKFLNVKIALKVQTPGAMTENALLRFQSEAKLSSKLKHKNIATVKDFGLHNQIPYLSMEYIDGQPLDLILRDQTVLDGSKFYDVFLQVCSALRHAHANGVIHRDIKPGNIILSETDNGDLLVKVLDFGIARSTTYDTESSKLTGTGVVIGTPLYMSPEQAKGQGVNPSSDVYALGCVMWHCLTGAPPFARSSSMETIMEHIEGTLPELRVETNLSVQESLEECLKDMLSKDPVRRPTLDGLEKLLSDLSHLPSEELSESAVESPTPPGPMELGYPRSKPDLPIRLFAGAAIVGSFLVGAFVMALRLPEEGHRPEPKREFVADQEPIASADATEKTADIEKRLSDNGTSFTVRLAATDESIEKLAGNKKILKIDISENPAITDECLKFVRSVPNLKHLNLTRTSVKTLDLLGESQKLEKVELKEDAINDRSLQNLLPLKQLDNLKLSECLGITDNGIATVAKIKSIGDLSLDKNPTLTTAIAKYLVTMPNLRHLCMTETKMDANFARKIAAMPSMESLDLRDCQRFSHKDQLSVAKEFPLVTINLNRSVASQIEKEGLKAEDEKDYARALQAYNHVLSFLKNPARNRWKHVSDLYMRAAVCAEYLRKYDEADRLFSKSILFAQRCDDDSTIYGAVTTKFAFDAQRGDRKRALAELCDAAAKREKRGEPSVAFGMLQEFIGRAYREERDYREASRWLEKAEKTYRASDRPQSALVCNVIVLDGESQRGLKNEEAASQRFRQALALIAEAKPNREEIKMLAVTKATALTGIASIYLRRKEFEKALKYINQSVHILEIHNAPANTRSSAYTVKAKILRKLGQMDEAEEFAKRSKEVLDQVPKTP